MAEDSSAERPPKLISLERLDICQGGRCVCRVGPWDLHAGQRWWVRGPNGCGKSSLLRVVAGQLWPAPGHHEKRRYQFDGEATWSPMAAKGRVALLNPDLQNRYLHQDWDLSAAEVVATGFLDTDILHEKPALSEMTRLASLMDQLAIRSLWSRPFLELSQGERRRVLIARALALDPEILLLDEFAEGLDRPSRETLWRTLESLAKAGTAIVLTTHRPGPALDGWEALDVEPSDGPSPADGNPDLRDQASSDGRQSDAQSPTPKRLIQAKGQLYLEGQLLLDQLDWELRHGDHTAVLGANGCGKTSFLRLLWGELHLAFGGTLTHFEDPNLTVHALRRHIGYFQPDMHAWFRPETTAEEVILSGLFSTIELFNPVTDAHREQAARAAAALEAERFLARPLGTLSYGQARRVLLARALASRPRLALLDEPFDGLDKEVRQHLFQILASIAESRETTFVLTSHHAEDRPPWIRSRVRITADHRLEKLRD